MNDLQREAAIAQAPTAETLATQAGTYGSDLAILLRWEAERLEEAGWCFFMDMADIAAGRSLAP